MDSDVIVVANGLVVDGDKVYLARNQRKFGDGVSISGSQGGGAVGVRLPVYNGADPHTVIGGAETEET